MYGLIVFDLDGTLIDSRRDIADAANAMLIACGAAPLAETTIGAMVGDGAPTLVARAFAAAKLAQPPDALSRFVALYDERLLRHTRPYPQIPSVLHALAARTPLAVLTNKPLSATRRILDGLDLAPYFPEARVLGGDGPWPRKPDPSGLRQLMARAGAQRASTILVGDSFIDLQTARNADTALCLVRYGFGFDTFPSDDLRNGDQIVDTPVDLLRLL
jgi:phosphoglycolate phosphatase